MRLFFAYWPTPQEADKILPWVYAAHALCGGRMMRRDILHMTLAFLGETDDAATHRLIDASRQWVLPAGSMLLREPGCFRNAKVVWLGPAATESCPLEWLYQANTRLWSYLAPLGWNASESEFRPHVSLLRNARAADLSALTGAEVHWTPGRCVLVGSQPASTGSHYTVLAELAVEAA